MQTVIVDTEVMAEFMQNCLTHLFADLIVRLANGLDGFLVNADLVRRYEVVKLAALGERDSVVQAQQQTPRANASQFPVSRGRPALDHDVDVVDVPHQLRREQRHRFADEPAKLCAFQ